MQTYQAFEEVERGNSGLSVSAEVNITSDYKRKVLDTSEFILKCLDISVNPVCLCSFGKDSLVLLHLILKHKKVPVIYWKEPFFQSKFWHPLEVATKWDLDVYDYPPTATEYLKLDDYFDVYNFYYVNGIDWVNLYTGTRQFKDGERFLCAKDDLLNRPKVPAYEFKWDMIFHGHKQSDKIYIADKIDLPDFKLFGNGAMALPIRDWTDQDIWTYIKDNDLPYNKDRYDLKDESKNNDLFPTCHRCLDYRTKSCICPKSGKEMECTGRTKEENEALRKTLLGVAYK